eukprot:gene8159-12619_t
MNQENLRTTLGDTIDRNYPVALDSQYNDILLKYNQVYSFGDGSYGKLGVGNTDQHNSPHLIPGHTDIIMVSAGVYHSLILNEKGYVFAFGSNSHGKLGIGSTTDRWTPTLVVENNGNIKKISSGGEHSGMLTNDGKVYFFGDNNNRQLGIGDTSTDSLVPNLEWVTPTPNFQKYTYSINQ